MWYPRKEMRIKNCFQVSNLDNQVNAPITSDGKKTRRMRLRSSFEHNVFEMSADIKYTGE